MSNIKEYENFDAIDLANKIKAKEFTPFEVLDTAIAKAQLYNPKLNAIVHTMYDYAREQCKDIDLNAPFAGVPFLLKDLYMLMEGFPTSNGSRFFVDNIAGYDSELVCRFKRAGFNIFGKSNTPELGLSYTTESLLFGPCHNPWDLGLTPGGSSGGAAAAVAARIVPAAHASDGGGSIRVPAACCGLFGLKPTRGRTPYGPDLGEGWSGLSTNHVVSLSVRDSAAILDCIAGHDIGDPYYAPPQSHSYLASLKTQPRPLKIAIATQAMIPVQIAEECVTAVENTARLCQDLGHEIIHAQPQYNPEPLAKAFATIVSANASATIERYSVKIGRQPRPGEIEPLDQKVLQQNKTLKASDYALALFAIHRIARDIAKFFQEYDILITPTTATPPVKIGHLQANNHDFNYEELAKRFTEFGPFTSVWNMTGQPAMNVPLHWTKENIPIGVQFIGRFGDEELLLQLAAQLEQAKPWRDRRPELS